MSAAARTACSLSRNFLAFVLVLSMGPAFVTAAAAQTNLYFIHTDHLNTPRLVADAAGTTVWRWDQGEPFGVNVADQNPSGLGAFEFPMRFPGQYFDKDTGIAYNIARDYDAGIGRYVESDPIGLRGGVNTYGYVTGDPIKLTDPDGLQGAMPNPQQRQFTERLTDHCRSQLERKIEEWDSVIEATRRSLSECEKRCFIKCVRIYRTGIGTCFSDTFFDIFPFVNGCSRNFASDDSKAGQWYCERGTIQGESKSKCCAP